MGAGSTCGKCKCKKHGGSGYAKGKGKGKGSGKGSGAGKGSGTGDGSGQGTGSGSTAQGGGGQGNAGSASQGTGRDSNSGSGSQQGGGGPQAGSGSAQPGGPGGATQGDARTTGQNPGVGPQGGGLVSAGKAATETLRKFLRGEIDEKALEEAGISLQDLQNFLRNTLAILEARMSAANANNARPGEPGRPNVEVDSAAGEAKQGGGTDATGQLARIEMEKKERELKEFFDSIRDKISPEYRELLEEYFKTLAK
ncbi:MAG: hypothetical protein RDV41_00205 [Planctomycetota bacterium]|nr:hypothetical protein [Planctomycetota bacterium]